MSNGRTTAAKVYPTKKYLYDLLRLCKVWDVHTLTVSIDGKGNWHYQTGDNSYMGSCYFHPIWAVVGTDYRFNMKDVANDILEQLEEGYFNHLEMRSRE